MQEKRIQLLQRLTAGQTASEISEAATNGKPGIITSLLLNSDPEKVSVYTAPEASENYDVEENLDIIAGAILRDHAKTTGRDIKTLPLYSAAQGSADVEEYLQSYLEA